MFASSNVTGQVASDAVEPPTEPAWVMSVLREPACEQQHDATEDALSADLRAVFDEDAAQAIVALQDPAVREIVTLRNRQWLAHLRGITWRNFCHVCPRRNHDYNSTSATATTTDYNSNSTSATANTTDYNTTTATANTTDLDHGTTVTMTTTTNHDYDSTAATSTTTLLPGDWPMQGLESQCATPSATAGCQLLMLGSGSCLHACPRDFAPAVPVEPVTAAVGSTAVNGQSIPVYGMRRVLLRTWGGILLHVLFYVMAVSRPLLSVGLLRRRGYEVHMAGRSYLAKAGKRAPLVENDSLFYLPVVYGPGMGEQHVHNMVGIERSLPCVPVHALGMPAWHLVEWCCERGSQLADWFTSHAQSAKRLHLPEHDMRTRVCARQVVRNVMQVTARGTNVLLWAAFPCGPWRNWQRVNMCSGTSTAERIRLQKLESQRMLAVW